jgi:hypothetical protein
VSRFCVFCLRKNARKKNKKERLVLNNTTAKRNDCGFHGGSLPTTHVNAIPTDCTYLRRRRDGFVAVGVGVGVGVIVVVSALPLLAGFLLDEVNERAKRDV